MAFLPEDYTLNTSNGGNYLKVQDWETIKIRILTDSITWWEYFRVNWEKTTPVRQQKPFDTVPNDSKDGAKPKEFWAFWIYNYEEKRVQIWEVTQGTIKQVIFNLYKDPDFWDPKWYDIKISRTGKWLDTKYNVVPLNKWDFKDKDIIAEAKAIRLEALYDNDDPFKPL